MKLTILTIAALPFIAACAQPITLVCDREAIEWTKWGEVAELPELCQPPAVSPRPLARPIVHGSDDNDPQPPTVTPPTSKPPVSEPPKEPPSEEPDAPDVPDTPDVPDSPSNPDKPDRVKGNNGWGNGDQSAPGNSGPNNNAENDKGGRNQNNHGQARSD